MSCFFMTILLCRGGLSTRPLFSGNRRDVSGGILSRPYSLLLDDCRGVVSGGTQRCGTITEVSYQAVPNGVGQLPKYRIGRYPGGVGLPPHHSHAIGSGSIPGHAIARRGIPATPLPAGASRCTFSEAGNNMGMSRDALLNLPEVFLCVVITTVVSATGSAATTGGGSSSCCSCSATAAAATTTTAAAAAEKPAAAKRRAGHVPGDNGVTVSWFDIQHHWVVSPIRSRGNDPTS